MPIIQTDEPPYAVVASVCDIIARPREFDGKRIEISGRFSTDWYHSRMIVGEPCGAGIDFAGDTKTLGDAWTAIEATNRQRGDPEIRLTVVGRYHWDPEASGMFPRTHVITVDRIVFLTIKER